MERYSKFVEKLSIWMQAISGFTLVFIMFLTVTDVVGRLFGYPVVGTYEIVGLGGAVIISFAIPITSWYRGHVYVDFFIQRFSKNTKALINICTRVISIALFITIGWNLFIIAYEYYKSGEVTLTRQLPFYLIAYGMGVCCFIQCLVLISDIMKVIGGKYE